MLYNSCCTSLPPKTILSVFLPYSFVLPYKRKTKGRRRGKESDNERCSIEPTRAVGTWGTFVGIFAKGGEWWRRMRFGSRRSFVILQPKQNYPKSVIRNLKGDFSNDRFGLIIQPFQVPAIMTSLYMFISNGCFFKKLFFLII